MWDGVDHAFGLQEIRAAPWCVIQSVLMFDGCGKSNSLLQAAAMPGERLASSFGNRVFFLILRV